MTTLLMLIDFNGVFPVLMYFTGSYDLQLDFGIVLRSNGF